MRNVLPRLIFPTVGSSSPASSRRTEVLPVPLTPARPMRAPGPIDQSSDFGHLRGARGEGPGAAKRVLPNYTIDSSSVQKTSIGGHPALIATGQYQRDGKNFGELLGWIFSENTRTHFVVQSTADDLSALRTPFEQMLQSAKIP